MPQLLIVALVILYIVGTRITRAWVARRWADERLSDLGAVIILLGGSGFGLSVLFAVAIAVLHPSADSMVMLVVFLCLALVIFGFGMTAATYASAHGVREHLRAERARQEQAKRS